jgi:hypothetical protein
MASQAKFGISSYALYIPVYYHVMTYIVAVSLVVGAVDMSDLIVRNPFYLSLKFGAYRLVLDGLATFLMHNGVGVRPVRNSLGAGALSAAAVTFLPVLAYLSLDSRTVICHATPPFAIASQRFLFCSPQCSCLF